MTTNDQPAMTRSEEELHVRIVSEEAGRVRLRKAIEDVTVDEPVDLLREHLEVERVPADPGDDGEVHTFPDGSVSIPVWREEVEVRRRWVVGERIVARKAVETVHEQVAAQVRRERIKVEAQRSVAGRVSPRRRRGRLRARR